MIGCPLCEFRGTRTDVHAHLVDEHPEAVEMWTDAETGKRRYRIACPQCDAAHEAQVKPRSHDPAFLQTFAREIRMVAFDMLLAHLVAEHGTASAGEPADARSSLPLAGPGGGRGRPGLQGVPLPPGMDELELPAWAQSPRPARETKTGSQQ
jgi:hypothetical protein